MGNQPSSGNSYYNQVPQAQPDWSIKNGPGTWIGGAAGAATGQAVGGAAGSFIGAAAGQGVGRVADVACDMQGRQTQMDYQNACQQGMCQDNAARYAINVNNL